MRKINILVLAILVFSTALLAYLIHDFNNTEKALAYSILNKPMRSSSLILKGFVSPVKSVLISLKDQMELERIDSITPQYANINWGTIINAFPQISAIGISNTAGFDLEIFPAQNGFDQRFAWEKKWGKKEFWSFWEYDKNSGKFSKQKEWVKEKQFISQKQDWFTEALNLDENQIYWTEPYRYHVHGGIGVTASIKVEPVENVISVLAIDLSLADLTSFSEKFTVTPHGKIFLLSDQGKYISIPEDTTFSNKNDRLQSFLKDVDSVNIPSVSNAYHHWKEVGQETSDPFKYINEGKKWWGKFLKFPVSDNKYMIIGLVVPEKDILFEIERTKFIIIGAFVFILLLSVFVFYALSIVRKNNRELIKKNAKIREQKEVIESKNTKIMDSIIYAKRLQTSILPTDKQFQSLLPHSFVFYKPKDILSGDFYWIEKKEDKVFFAAADCTGHGVPGALVSVVCIGGMNKTFRELGAKKPSEILEGTRTIVIRAFEKSEEKINDGMDIALCMIEKDHLEYTGAHNPLWIIRKGSSEIEEIKGDKQPVGQFVKPKPFSNHTVELQKGDTIYIFSDGFVDQFGGAKGKKYMTKNFKRFLLSIQDLRIEEQKDRLEEEFNRWKGQLEQVDDVCVIGYKHPGSSQ